MGSGLGGCPGAVEQEGRVDSTGDHSCGCRVCEALSQCLMLHMANGQRLARGDLLKPRLTQPVFSWRGPSRFPPSYFRACLLVGRGCGGKYFRPLERPSPVGAPWESLGNMYSHRGPWDYVSPTQAPWEACFPPRAPGVLTACQV